MWTPLLVTFAQMTKLLAVKERAANINYEFCAVNVRDPMYLKKHKKDELSGKAGNVYDQL